MRCLSAFACLTITFLLLTSCGSSAPAPSEDEVVFTEEDIARFRELVLEAEQAGPSEEFVPHLVDETSDTDADEELVLNSEQVQSYAALRATSDADGAALFRVTNEFLNVRSEPKVTAAAVTRLNQGDTLAVLSFVDAAWAHVQLPNGEEGYVASRYIAKPVSEASVVILKSEENPFTKDTRWRMNGELQRQFVSPNK